MSAENVVINFVGNTEELKPVESALDAIVKKEGDVGDAWKKTADKITAANKTNTQTNNNLAKSIDQMMVAAKSMDKVAIGGAYKNYLKQIQAQLGLTNKELVAYIKNARDSARENVFSATTEAEIDALSESIKVMNEELGNLGEGEDEVAAKTQSFKAAIAAAKLELKALYDAGKSGTQEFADLQQRIADMTDEAADFQATFANLGSDTRNLDGLISLVGGIAGGFAVAQGAAALFGSENEDIQKALVKLNAAMAILQGLTQVQNVLQAESSAMLLLNSLRTRGLAIQQQFLAATTLGSAAATGVLRTALIASRQPNGSRIVTPGTASE